MREAEQAIKRRDTPEAFELLRRAEAAVPDDVSVHLYKSLAHRVAGDLAAAQRAVEKALTLDPYNFVARLSRAWLLDQQGRKRQAATMYEQALAIAPPAERIPPDLEGPVERAREVVAERNAAFKAHLLQRVADVRARHPDAPLERFDDDTIEHEARNDNDELRMILIFDVWNPYLSEGERELVTAMLSARTEFLAADS